MTDVSQPIGPTGARISAPRVAPTALIGYVIAIGYVLLFLALESMMRVRYTEIGTTADSVVRGIVIPLSIVALVMAAVTTWLGWWRPVLRERPLGVKWLWAVPVLLIAVAVVGVNYSQLGAVGVAYLSWLAVGTLLVGFNEEVTFRGLSLVGFRGQYKEAYVWLASSLLFSLLHGINFTLGQSLVPTLQQVGFAFVLGSIFYVARRVTGSLVFLMGVHALWDFGAFTFLGGLAATGVAGSSVVVLARLPLIVVLVVLCLLGAKRLFTTPVAEAE